MIVVAEDGFHAGGDRFGDPLVAACMVHTHLARCPRNGQAPSPIPLHAWTDGKLLERISGEAPVVVTSDDPEAKDAIDAFRKSRQRWIVAVRMVSEGVDIPRLAVGVYASKIKTPLFFRQVVGRFVRVRPGEEFNARRLFIPAIHQLEIEAQREQSGESSGEASQGTLDLRESLSATEAEFDRAILGGEETSPDDYSTAQAKCRELGIPAQYALNILPLLRRAPVQPAPTRLVTETPQHRREKLLRQSVETLARKVAFKAGVPPKQVNIDLLKAGHPARPKATIAELEAIERHLAKWLGES